MSDPLPLEVIITTFQVMDAWEASYPGDPVVRPTYYQYDFICNNRIAMENYLCNFKRCYSYDFKSRLSSDWYKQYKGWSYGTVDFTDKPEALLFRLSWPALDI